jgi:hypothetical protein
LPQLLSLFCDEVLLGVCVFGPYREQQVLQMNEGDDTTLHFEFPSVPDELYF